MVMNWSEGHIWRVVFSRRDLPERFEFKFVICEHKTKNVSCWEGKGNRKFNLPEFLATFSQPSVLEALRDGGSADGVVNLTFPDSKDMVSYIKAQRLMSLFCPWRSI